MWTDKFDDNATKLAETIIHELLNCKCLYNSDKQGKLVNQLSNAMYQGASTYVLYDMFKRASRIDDYLSLTFIIEESKVHKNEELFPLIKKLINIGYLRITYPLLPYYSINSETGEGFFTLIDFLSNRNIVVCAYAMNCISYLLSDKQIYTLSYAIKTKTGISDIFIDSDFDRYVQIMKHGTLNEKILTFCAMARKNMYLNKMLILEKAASCEEIHEFFHFYVLDKINMKL